MTVTVTGNDLWDLRNKIGVKEPRANIRIDFIQNDFGRVPEIGCVVDATSISGELVKRHFETSGKALAYIGGLLRKHDKWAKVEAARKAKELKSLVKKK